MNTMIPKTFGLSSRAALARRLGAVALAAMLAGPTPATAQVPFAKPDQATDALIDALASGDRAALPRLLGKDWKQLLPANSLDVDDVYSFLEKAHQSRKVTVDGRRAELAVGTDPWTLPVPLTQGKDGLWRFDPVAARVAIAERRIGANERAAMTTMLAYLDAQRDYAQADRNGDGLLEYAQKLISSPGKRDGLIWSASLGDQSPLGEAFLPEQPHQGYHGYRFKILTGQGPHAPGGARSYLLGPRMVTGFALVAWPVRYGDSGVMSFLVNQDGRVYQRDLGPATARAAAAITRFDPDAGWKPARP